MALSSENKESSGAGASGFSARDITEQAASEERIGFQGQLNKELSAEDTASLVTFLTALTGEAPKAALTAPKPLPSGPETPRPDPS